ncbi:MAG: hypothetical protein C6I00_05100 [Nitratiruptor sp.]|nr:hypothetical protein [Nitratiruptor sp.]NPA84288.1 flagellar protein FlaG [Campylobacterota bacterium]
MEIQPIELAQKILEFPALPARVDRGHEGGLEEQFLELDESIQHSLLEDFAKLINERMEAFAIEVRIEIDEETRIQVVKLIDNRTHEVLRQLPPEAILKIAKYIDEISGVFLEERA